MAVFSVTAAEWEMGELTQARLDAVVQAVRDDGCASDQCCLNTATLVFTRPSWATLPTSGCSTCTAACQ